MIPTEGEQQPTYGELAALVVTLTSRLDALESRNAELEARVAVCEAENAELRAENAELRRQLGMNSRNSSKPPSSDGLSKPPPRSMRGKSGRRAGKQPGTPGGALMQVAKADKRVDHRPVECRGCGDVLDGALGADEPVARQVFDVREVKVEVTEHLLHAARCTGCGTVTRAQAPVGVEAPAVYGPNVTMMAAYLSAQHHIPIGRVVEILADLAGIGVSTGWVAGACARMADAVEGANTAIKDALAVAPVAHFDESVTRINGKNHWLHVAATTALTALPHRRARPGDRVDHRVREFCPASPGSRYTTPTRLTRGSKAASTLCATRASCARPPHRRT